MFNSLRKLFGKRVENAVDTTRELRTPMPPMLTVTPGFTPRTSRTESQPRTGMVAADSHSMLAIPLKSILSRLPADLMQRVRQLDVGEVEVSVSMQKVLSQIGQGAVKLSFGELRRAAPPGTFTSENDLDGSLVDLPLHEVIARMNLALLPRRSVQKHVEVPPEVTGPFGGQCRVAISTKPTKPAAPPAQPLPPTRIQAPTDNVQQPAASFQPVQRNQPLVARIRNVPTVPEVAPTEPAPSSAQRFDVEEPALNPVFNRIGSFTTPSAPPSQPVFTPIAPEPAPLPTVQPAAIPMPEAIHNPPTPAPITPIASATEPEPELIRFNPPAPVPKPVVAVETRFLTVALAEVAKAWPEAVKDEIIVLKATASSIGLPFGVVEVALKQGKVVLPWKTIRSWIKPSLPPSLSAFDGTVLELPLKVVAPLFLAELRSTKPQGKVSVDEAIPDLFFDGTRQSDVPSAPVPPSAPAIPAVPAAPPVPVIPAASSAPVFPSAPPAPVKTEDTNFFNRNEKVEETEDEVVFLKKDGTPGTAFLKRYATPNEIVNKAAALHGVDGALIALPDGLLVASMIPSTMNADTVAAFLPQIFGKVTQCTRELRLGDLNNLNFTVGNIPWKIFKVGAIYFAAFGRMGEAMPTAQLAGLAAELDHKSK